MHQHVGKLTLRDMLKVSQQALRLCLKLNTVLNLKTT